jgi:hypothetical protein
MSLEFNVKILNDNDHTGHPLWVYVAVRNAFALMQLTLRRMIALMHIVRETVVFPKL